MTDQGERDFNERNIEEFRANGGKVGGQFEGFPLLLLTSTGAKSGAQRVNPVAYFDIDGTIYIVGSSAGRDRDPAWAFNIRAHPDVTVEIGTGAPRAVTARELPREERDPVYEIVKQRAPGFADYETRTDRVINTTAFGLLAIPSFVLAFVLSYVVGVRLGWLPTSGYAPGWLDPLFDSNRSPDLWNHFKNMVLPVIALAVGQVAIYMRLLRSDMIQTLQENFITMAKAKGVSNRRILFRHALRPSSLTLLTVAGLSIGTLIGGSLVVEALLRIPGMGLLIGDAVLSRQYVALQSAVALIAIGFVLLNFLIDYLYTVLDPRIRERTS